MNFEEIEKRLSECKQLGVSYSSGSPDPIFESVRIPHDVLRKLLVLAKLQHECLCRVGRDQFAVIEDALVAYEEFDK